MFKGMPVRWIITGDKFILATMLSLFLPKYRNEAYKGENLVKDSPRNTQDINFSWMGMIGVIKVVDSLDTVDISEDEVLTGNYQTTASCN